MEENNNKNNTGYMKEFEKFNIFSACIAFSMCGLISILLMVDCIISGNYVNTCLSLIFYVFLSIFLTIGSVYNIRKYILLKRDTAE